MIYEGVFEDINGNSHYLRIGSSGNTVTLKFSGSPFITTMDESDSLLYMPVKCQAGTVGLVAVDTDYMFGLYTGDAQGMPVTLYSGTTANSAAVEWMGFVSPSLYDIGYTKYLEALDVDCVDGLATLEQYKYKPVNGSTAEVCTLLDIVRHCIARCNCYTMMKLSTATKLGSSDARDLWQYCYISERNFMSQDTTATDGEDDKTYKEVLESICQWVGVTAVAKGDTVYFIDYDALLDSTNNESIVVDVAGGTVTTGSMAVADYAISGDSYASSGARLSLDKVYTKVTIKDELNEFDDLLPDLFDDATNITADDSTFKSNTGVNRVSGEYLEPGTGDNMLVGCNKVSDGPVNAVAFKYYKPTHATLYHYSGSTSTTTGIDSTNFTHTQTYNGGWLVRAYVKQLEHTSLPTALDAYTLPITSPTLDLLYAVNDIHSLSFDEYVFLINHTSNHISTNLPFLQTSGENATALFGGANCRLLISGDILWHKFDDYMYPVPEEEQDYSDGAKTCPAEDAYLIAKLEWGGKYWTGGAWSSTETTFKIPFMVEDQRYDAVMFKSLGIVNMVRWRFGSDDSGYAITMPSRGSVIYGDQTFETILFGTPKLTLYQPHDMGSYHKTVFMAIKNLRIQPMVINPTFSDDMDDDTVYTNIIDTSNSTDMDEITYNVCTWDNKKPNFSAVAYVDGEAMRWVDKTYHPAMTGDEDSVTPYDGEVTSPSTLRQEEHMLHRLVNQYSEPAKVLNVTLHDNCTPNQLVTESNLSTSFIIDKVDIDYKQQIYSYKLIEKK